MIKHSYLHIPFCRQKCNYCAFSSFINLNFIEKYLEALFCQIKKEYEGTLQETLYIGGGTPSLLSLNQIEKILSHFNFVKKPEITIEVNPENLDIAYFKGLLEIGINRISIGAQTFDDRLLLKAGRRHGAKEAMEAVLNARRAGFKNISIDLMYGLLNQKVEDVLRDIKIAKELDIQHISTYGLKIEDKTFWGKNTPKGLPDEDIQAEMYKKIVRGLDDFLHYEISNFALNENFIGRHNLSYWKMKPYNGFGLAAAGFDGKMRYKNTENLKKYLENPFLKDEKIEADTLEETIFLGFRCKEGINIYDIETKFNINFEKKYGSIIKKYLNSGHILKTKNGYSLSLEGVLISNYILCDFL